MSMEAATTRISLRTPQGVRRWGELLPMCGWVGGWVWLVVGKIRGGLVRGVGFGLRAEGAKCLAGRVFAMMLAMLICGTSTTRAASPFRIVQIGA